MILYAVIFEHDYANGAREISRSMWPSAAITVDMPRLAYVDMSYLYSILVLSHELRQHTFQYVCGLCDFLVCDYQTGDKPHG